MLQNVKFNTHLLVQQILVPRVRTTTSTVPAVATETDLAWGTVLVAERKCDYHINDITRYYNCSYVTTWINLIMVKVQEVS